MTNCMWWMLKMQSIFFLLVKTIGFESSYEQMAEWTSTPYGVPNHCVITTVNHHLERHYGFSGLECSSSGQYMLRKEVSLFHIHTWAHIHTEENAWMMYLWSMFQQGSPWRLSWFTEEQGQRGGCLLINRLFFFVNYFSLPHSKKGLACVKKYVHVCVRLCVMLLTSLIRILIPVKKLTIYIRRFQVDLKQKTPILRYAETHLDKPA